MAYSVGSSAGTGFRFPGLFFAYTMTKSETSQKATQMILDEIKKFMAEGPTDEELADAKDGILNSEVFNYDTKREILDRLVMFERYGYEPDFLQKYQEAVQNLTKEQVLEAINAVWHPDKMTIFAVGNYADWDGDFSTFGPVTMVDITIPEPALEIPDATPASLAAGMDLMKKCRQASGGEKKFTSLKSLFEKSSLAATIQGMDMTITTEKSVVYPDKSYTKITLPFGTQSVCLAGDKGWAVSPMGTQDLEGEQLADARNELKTDVTGVFRNLDEFKCQALEQKEIDGVLCNPVHLSGVGDGYQIFFLGADDNLVKMIQSPGTAPMTGAPVTQKIYVDEYQTVDGYTMPKVIRLLYDDELFGTGTVEEFKANPKVDMSLFEKSSS